MHARELDVQMVTYAWLYMWQSSTRPDVLRGQSVYVGSLWVSSCCTALARYHLFLAMNPEPVGMVPGQL
jgi:hypothetical protein